MPGFGFLGDISYSTYLIHFPMQLVPRAASRRASASTPSDLHAGLGDARVLRRPDRTGRAVLRLFERPAQSWLRTRAGASARTRDLISVCAAECADAPSPSRRSCRPARGVRRAWSPCARRASSARPWPASTLERCRTEEFGFQPDRHRGQLVGSCASRTADDGGIEHRRDEAALHRAVTVGEFGPCQKAHMQGAVRDRCARSRGQAGARPA